jgi:glutaredoxin
MPQAACRAGGGGNVLLSFLFGRHPRRPDLSFVLYTRRGCHLCDTAWQVLQQARRRYGFALQAVDVDSSEELRALHGTSVPVVTVNGRLRFRGAVSRVLLQRILDAKRL